MFQQTLFLPFQDKRVALRHLLQIVHVAMQQNSTVDVVVFDNLFIGRCLDRIETIDLIDQIADSVHR